MAMPIDLYRNYDSEDGVYAEDFFATFPPINAIDNGLEIYDWSWSQHNFLGWNTARDGSGTSYQSGDSVPSGVYAFYAIWEEAVVVPDVTVTYAGSQITSMSASGTKTLLTSGKYCEDDITIQYTKPPVITPVYQTKTVSPTTSPQTVSPDNGYDGLSQVTVNAISPTKAAQTYTPTTSNQTIYSGRWLTGNQTIKGDANLVASNIKKDVQIFGVTGSYEGGSNPVEEKDVNFIDYDGTLLYSYTASEFAALTALPANPSHTGLTAQGWNWTLPNAKTYVASYGKLWIGQMYITESGDTEIDIELHAPRLSPYLGIAVNGTVEVDWGDGTAKSTVTGTSLTSQIRTLHVYATDGSCTIKIHVVRGSFSLYGTSTYAILSGNLPADRNKVYSNNVQRVRIGSSIAKINTYAFYNCYSLTSVTIPSGITSISTYAFCYCYSLTSVTIPSSVTSIGNSAFSYCYSLTSVTIPSGITSISTYAFSYCYSLTSVTIPSGITSISTYAFQNCYSLASVTIPSNVTSIDSSAFYNCYSLASVTIPSGITSISTYAFQNCYGLGLIRFEPTTPPTVSNSNAWTSVPTDCLILIPCNRRADYTESWYAERYLAATNYPSKSTYIYIGYWTFGNNDSMLPYNMDNYTVYWFPTIEDAVARTNRIFKGNGNEIYCRFDSMDL